MEATKTYSAGFHCQTSLPKQTTPHIITGEDNVVFHMEWDNMNKVNDKA